MYVMYVNGFLDTRKVNGEENENELPLLKPDQRFENATIPLYANVNGKCYYNALDQNL